MGLPCQASYRRLPGSLCYVARYSLGPFAAYRLARDYRCQHRYYCTALVQELNWDFEEHTKELYRDTCTILLPLRQRIGAMPRRGD